MKIDKGTLGFIFVIIALLIAAINAPIGIICILIIYIFAFIDSKPTNNSDHPFL